MAFTAKGNETRTRIIEGAARVLRDRDFAPLTLDDIRAATSTSKSQLFHYFPEGKDELLLEVMRREAQRVLDDQEPEIGRLDSWASWNNWRDVVIERYRQQGVRCPLNSLMSQLGSTPGAAAVTNALLERWGGLLAEGISVMQARGEMRSDRTPHHLAAGVIAGIQGGVVVMWSTSTTEHLEASLDLLMTALRA
ncbi:TetR/AcrR family transcriptional regulator [Leifsonia aquatica]|uniref:TetR/AcrR family transcriptional regulator n=1 Tax=Leifsonia aquatica TaxID=144185 RepID=UPI00384FAE1C